MNITLANKAFALLANEGLNCNFLNSSNPFFKRGGNYNNGSNAGVFNSNNNNGNGNNNNSFRVVLGGAALRYTRRRKPFNLR